MKNSKNLKKKVLTMAAAAVLVVGAAVPTFAAQTKIYNDNGGYYTVVTPDSYVLTGTTLNASQIKAGDTVLLGDVIVNDTDRTITYSFTDDCVTAPSNGHAFNLAPGQKRIVKGWDMSGSFTAAKIEDGKMCFTANSYVLTGRSLKASEVAKGTTVKSGDVIVNDTGSSMSLCFYTNSTNSGKSFVLASGEKVVVRIWGMSAVYTANNADADGLFFVAG
jgi:hypothetical protein